MNWLSTDECWLVFGITIILAYTICYCARCLAVVFHGWAPAPPVDDPYLNLIAHILDCGLAREDARLRINGVIDSMPED